MTQDKQSGLRRDMAWRAFVARMQHKLGPDHIPDETVWEYMREAYVDAYANGYLEGNEVSAE